MQTTRDDQSASPVALVDEPIATWRQVLSLSWPVLIQQLLILAVNLSDRFLAGYFLPADASKHVAYQAAQTTGGYLAWFINSYILFVSVGSTALVARFVGAGNWDAARRATGQSILLAVFFGVVGTVAGLLGMKGLIATLQLHGDAADYAATYLLPLFALLVFPLVESAGIACLVGAGDTRTGMLVRGGVALLNLPLSWGFYHGFGPVPAFGFMGITLGTAVSHLLGALAVLVVLAHGRAGLQLTVSLLRPDRDLMTRLLRISIPAGIDSMSVVLGQFWFLRIVNSLNDDDARAAHGIALEWEGLGYMSGAAFATAAMTLVGQNLGARRPRQAAHAGWVAFGMGCTVMSVMGAVFYVLAPQMFRLFCPYPHQQGIIAAGVPALRLVAFAMPAAASWIIFVYALRGAGDTRVPVLFTWIGFLGVRIPLAYLLTAPHDGVPILGSWQGGLLGAWIAMFADLMVRGAFFLYRFASGRWKKIEV